MTNKELRRRETDKLAPYVQQVALDHANKRIAELEAMMQWQAIGTAKNYYVNDILILLRSGKIVVAFWSELFNCWKSDSDVVIKNATHWMPLPNLPTADKKGE